MDWDEAHELNAAVRAVAMRHRAMAAAALAELGLSPGQEVVLLELGDLGPRTQSQLSAAAGCEPPTTTLAVRKLEAMGLIRRTPSPTDGRVVIVDLTPAGQDLLPRLRQVWIALAEAAVQGMGADDVADLRRSLTAFAGSLRALRHGAACPGGQPMANRSMTSTSDPGSAVSNP